MVYVEERNYNDCIFDLPQSISGNTLPTSVRNDHRYDKHIMRLFCFSNLLGREVAYSVIDAVPLVIPNNNIGFPLLDVMLKINNRNMNPLGVYIIKEYTYTRTHQIVTLLEYWSKGGFDIPEDGLRALKESIKNFELKQSGLDKLVFRLVEFVPRNELVRTKVDVNKSKAKPIYKEDIRDNKFKSINPNEISDTSHITNDKIYSPYFSRFLNGIITLNLDISYNTEPSVNSIEISLPSNNTISRGTHWMVIGDVVIPISPRNTTSTRDTLILRYQGQDVSYFEMDNLSDFNIYDNLDEAYQNRISSNIKKAKLRLEEDKLTFDNKKLILEHTKLKSQMRLQEYTLKIQYNIELIKLLLSENALKTSENNTVKSYIEGGIKIVVAIENLVKKFKQ